MTHMHNFPPPLLQAESLQLTGPHGLSKFLKQSRIVPLDDLECDHCVLQFLPVL